MEKQFPLWVIEEVIFVDIIIFIDFVTIIITVAAITITFMI